MATLLAGEQYGLSSIDNSRQNKSFVFVKLTDSAFRAIEEYIRNKGKLSQHATIQFLENEGQLSFPSLQPGHGHTFNFSLTSVADIEGPQGSFECVRQNGARSLDALGTLQSKMRIHANDDVYEATRKNWVAAEQQQKKNCTQVIKVSGPDIGRKVKVKKTLGGGGGGGGSSLPFSSSSSFSSRGEASPPGTHRVSGHSKLPSGGLSGFSSHHHLVSSSNNPSSSSSSSSPSSMSLNRSSTYGKQGNPDIMKCPLRERLVHLLALRPFKKPELLSRIRRDGLRERDKNSLSAVLKQVAYLRDNTFQLNHSLWNDVQEDWPFYSEQDRQVLKRRKPQNLTPPGSDGGSSSGSGQSPTSTHPGSPPSMISSSDLSAKRPGYFDGADGVITKRQRISHYRRPPENNHLSVSSSMSGGGGGGGGGGNRAPSPMLMMSQRPPPSIEEEKRRRATALLKEQHLERARAGMNMVGGNGGNMGGLGSYSGGLGASHGSGGGGGSFGSGSSSLSANFTTTTNSSSSSSSSNNNRVTSSSCSPDSQLETMEERRATAPPPPNVNDAPPAEFPNHLEQYTTIRTPEQRKRYKADFNSLYDEYRELHGFVEKVSRRFTDMHARLRKEEPGSEGWKMVKNRIVREYEESTRNKKFVDAKRRFLYLHEMLSHVKRLVLEYDSSGTANSMDKPSRSADTMSVSARDAAY